MAVGAVALISVASWACSEPDSDVGDSAAATSSVEVTPRGSGVAGWVIEPTATLAIARSALPERGIVPLDLRLPGRVEMGEPVKGRILSALEDASRERPLTGRVVGDGGTARVGVPADFLTPGPYRIEIDGGETGQSAALGYQLEVR